MNTPKMKNNELVSSTRFEDLSNELIYEIFNYLDSWEIYKTFVQLNIRFQYLFRSDIFRLKINLPLLAKRNVFLRCEKLRNQRKKCRNQLIACLDDLSNEIFYEIFDYLNGCEIGKTFSSLNSRFKQLLYSSSLLIKTHFYLFNYDKMINTSNELEIF
ncbi:unnamed protein product [Rotaria magnacalcarata]|uniref:F-box domain-containing protein n=1 Tax=Rotaria magnacalcarata TaxID=392030 RepID=A0A816YG61_9BILA|nr:unnamed protein product [Rotaria magnacalcarata]